MGWLLAMFDLPVMTDAERRAATRFRNDLLDDGFLMIQYSVYARPCVSYEQQAKHAERIRAIAPASGNIRLLFITDQQWINSISVIGERPIEETPADNSSTTTTTPTPRRKKHSTQKHIPGQIEFWE
jgi:CRISPR-associated protein Cas2